MGPLALLVGLLVGGSASAGSFREVSARLEAHAAAFGAQVPPAPVAAPLLHRELAPPYEQPQAVVGEPALVVNLSTIRNALWRTELTFSAGGETVRLSGMKASNRDKDWFLSLCVDPCDPPIYKRGRDFVRYKLLIKQILDRSVIAELGGKPYKITLEGQLRNQERSRLRIAPAGGGPVLEWEVRQIAEAVYQTGTPVTLRGQEFRLLHPDEILQEEDGSFGGFSGERALLLMTRQGEKLASYLFRLSELLPGRVLVFSRLAAGSDPYPVLRVGFRLDGERLSVYDTEPPKRRR